MHSADRPATRLATRLAFLVAGFGIACWAPLVPFAAALGVEVIASRPDEVRARVEWRPERCTTGGVLHGGVIMSLADTTGAT